MAHAVKHNAQKDRLELRRCERRIGTPTLERTELPAVMSIFERLLERVCFAQIVPRSGRERIVGSAIEDHAVDVAFVAHDLREATIL